MCFRNICLLAVMIGIVTGGSGCSPSSELTVALNQSERGKVSLVHVSDESVQAAHPINVPADTIARVLRGMLVRADNSSTRAGASGSEPTRAFSEKDALFLAPLIADALKDASPDQQIAFTINQANAPVHTQRREGIETPPESSAPAERSAVTAGFLYAYGRSLYVTLTQFRSRPLPMSQDFNTGSRLASETTGSAAPTILFVPESARRPDRYRSSGSNGSTLVIDYELLARLPVDLSSGFSSRPVPPVGQGAGPAPTAKGEAPKKDPELEALRKELEEIKKQLAEQGAQRNPTPTRTPTTPKSTP